MSAEQGEPGDKVIVPVPLDEYLELLSAREILNRPVRHRVQAAEENITVVLGHALDKLHTLAIPEIRDQKRTKINCGALERKIFRAVMRFNRHHDYSKERPHATYIFNRCLSHYIFFYDEDAREKMLRAREDLRAKISNVPSFGLGLDAVSSLYPLPRTLEPPNLVEYKLQLPLQLNPLLPVYVATYFVPRPGLTMPSEINEVLS